MDAWDGLVLCSVCRDRETTSSVCWACREQEMIDDYVPLCCPECRSVMVLATDDNFTQFECQKCDHKWVQI